MITQTRKTTTFEWYEISVKYGSDQTEKKTEAAIDGSAMKTNMW